MGRREKKKEQEGETKSSCLPYRCSLPCKYFNGSRQSALPQPKATPFFPFALSGIRIITVNMNCILQLQLQ